VFSSRSLVCVHLSSSRSLVSAPVSASHKVSGPVCVSRALTILVHASLFLPVSGLRPCECFSQSLWSCVRLQSSDHSGPCSSGLGSETPKNARPSFVLLHPPDWVAWDGESPTSLERVTRHCLDLGRPDLAPHWTTLLLWSGHSVQKSPRSHRFRAAGCGQAEQLLGALGMVWVSGGYVSTPAWGTQVLVSGRPVE
jgi:hypothetical protein